MLIEHIPWATHYQRVSNQVSIHSHNLNAPRETKSKRVSTPDMIIVDYADPFETNSSGSRPRKLPATVLEQSYEELRGMARWDIPVWTASPRRIRSGLNAEVITMEVHQ